MATQRMKALKDFRYGTRMMRAGDTVDMKGPDVRLYRALGAIGPVSAKAKAESDAVVATTAPEPTPAPRKRTTRRKK